LINFFEIAIFSKEKTDEFKERDILWEHPLLFKQ